MFCRKCGKQILDDSRFCQYCGEAVQVVVGQVVEKTVKVSPEIAQNGGSLSVTIDGITKPIDIMLPPNMKDGQVLCLKKAKITDKSNPLRINYHERYQKIVDEYNKDYEKDEIAIIFENQMNLVNDMDEEERHYVREGFNSGEDLAIYDFLMKDSSSNEDVKKVKTLAQKLFKKIKAKTHELDRWTDKDETCTIINVLIMDILYTEFPPSYDDATLTECRQRIFEYVYSAYPAA